MGRKVDDKQQRYTVNSINKALDVLEALSINETMSLIELADHLKQPKSSLYRIIVTLELRGYITRDEIDGKYCLGFKPLEITKNLLENHSLRDTAMADMRQLSDRYGDTVNLGAWSDGEIVYVEIMEGTYSLRMHETVGSKVPFHATAIGKAIAATLPEEQVRELVKNHGLPPLTERTITDKAVLQRELQNIRQQGYALDDEESVLGARCIAAPIFNMFGNVTGAISLSGAKHRFTEDNLSKMAEDVKQAAKHISAKLGNVSDA